MIPVNLTDCVNSSACLWVLNMTGTFVVSILGIVGGAMILYSISKRNYKKAKHSARLVDKFLNPWLNGITKDTNNYCKIGAYYSEEFKKMIPLKSIEPKEQSNQRFYYEVMNNPKKYKSLIKDWKNLTKITLELNTELADLFEEIRISIEKEMILKEISLPYWCSHPKSPEPHKYICINNFTRAIYEEIKYPFETEYLQNHGSGKITDRIFPSIQINVWDYKWDELYLAVSLEKKDVEEIQILFKRFIEHQKYKEIIKALLDKQKDTYDIALEKVEADIENIIESIQLDNTVEEKVQHIVNPF